MNAACAQPGVLSRPFPALLRFAPPAAEQPAGEGKPGSNNWAVAGMHTRSGVALIANDMHLDLGVPAVWYPARLRVTGESAIDVTGVTLPGTPAWLRAPTVTSPGDSPTVTAISPTCASESARALTTRVRREHILVRDAGTVQVEYRDAGLRRGAGRGRLRRMT